MSSRNARNRRIYQRLAAIYGLAGRVPPIARPRARLFTLADIQPGQRVLVVGVGTGQDLVYLPSETAVVGIDLSPAMLARARARGDDADLREMNAEQLAFPDSSFDVVVLSYVLSVVGDPARALITCNTGDIDGDGTPDVVGPGGGAPAGRRVPGQRGRDVRRPGTDRARPIPAFAGRRARPERAPVRAWALRRARWPPGTQA